MPEIKISIVTDAKGAITEVKALDGALDQTNAAAKGAAGGLAATGTAAAKAGKESKESAGDTKSLLDTLTGLGDRELAEKITQIAGNLSKLGDIASGVAENDVAKFESGMQAAAQTAVTVVGAIAPQFAPIVAVLGVLISKVGEWITGIGDAAEKHQELNKRLEETNRALSDLEKLALIDAKSAEDRLEIERGFLEKRYKAADEAYKAEVELSGKWSEASQKAQEARIQVGLQLLQNETQRKKLIRDQEAEDSRKAMAKDLADQFKMNEEHRKRVEEADRKAVEETKQRKAKEAEESRADMAKALAQDFETREENRKKEQAARELANQDAIEDFNFEIEAEVQAREKLAEQIQGWLAAELAAADEAAGSEEDAARRRIAAYTKVAHSAAATAEQRKAAERGVAAEQKKLLEQEAKQYEDLAKKAASTVSGMVTSLIFQHKSLKEVVSETFKQLAQEVIAQLTQMAVTAIAKAVMTAAGVKGAAAAESAAHQQTMAAAVTSWAGAIPFVGPSVAAAFIAQFKALIAASSALKLAEGGTVAGRVPGFGRGDKVPADLEPGETVISNDLTDRLSRFLGRAEAGSAGPGAATTAISGELRIVHEFAAHWPPPERWADEAARHLIPAINNAVLRNGQRLVSSHLRSY